jgi:hypothetical protein
MKQGLRCSKGIGSLEKEKKKVSKQWGLNLCQEKAF